MKPIKFKEQIGTLLRPADMTDEECGPLPIFSDGKQIVSCWKPSLLDKIRLIIFGKIWLSVLSEITQPPVWLDTRKSIFEKRS